jgi:hypothetical protein
MLSIAQHWHNLLLYLYLNLVTLRIAVDENGDCLCYYGELSGKYVPTFRDYPSDPFSKIYIHWYWTLQSGSITFGMKLEVRADWFLLKILHKSLPNSSEKHIYQILGSLVIKKERYSERKTFKHNAAIIYCTGLEEFKVSVNVFCQKYHNLFCKSNFATPEHKSIT